MQIYARNPSSERKSNWECNVPCQISPKANLNLVRHILGTDWSLQFSMEGQHYYSRLRMQPNAYKENKYFATTSFRSEVPLSYFSFAGSTSQIQKPAIDFDKVIPGASSIARNCHSRNDREGVVMALAFGLLIRSGRRLRLRSIAITN